MLINEIMSKDVVCADPDEKLASIAKKMKDRDIGAVPVCKDDKLLGMVTDRDIVIRTLAVGADPSAASARQVMSSEPVSCRETESVEDAVHLMEQKRIRRLPVMDSKGHLVGMLSLDDIAIHASHELSGEALEALSFSDKTPKPTVSDQAPQPTVS